ncbi:putative phage tail protein [Escherichia coli]
MFDWERVYGVIPRDGATQQERRENILIKMAATGGLSIPYFKQLAASLGYTITITELHPFRAGINRCGDRLYITDARWIWQVNVTGKQNASLQIQNRSICCRGAVTFLWCPCTWKKH